MSLQNLSDLTIIDGNSECADCGSINISHASSKFGVFLCSLCSDIHRLIEGANGSIKSITSGPWSANEFDLIKAFGNNRAREHYEKFLPPFYRKPWETCAPCIREQFILAKYERQEFMKPEPQERYNTLRKRGILLKKLRDEDKYVERSFELSGEDNYLRYFIKEHQKDAKNTLDLDKMNVTFLDDSVPNVPKSCLQITYVVSGSTRILFVYSKDQREVVDWYNAIRCNKYHRLVLTLSGMNQMAGEIQSNITYDHLIEGYLEKTGPKATEAWRKRYCRLAKRRLMYSERQFDAFSKGEIFVGERSDGFVAVEGLPEGCKKSINVGVPFTLQTPGRNFLFLAPSDENRRRWVKFLNQVADTPMTVKERNEAATIVAKKGGGILPF